MTRSGAPKDHVGCFHEAAYYGTEAEFLALVVPFLEGGVAAGEPTLASFAEPSIALIKREMGTPSGVTFIDRGMRYQSPVTTISADCAAFASYVAQGALQIRIVGEMPHAGTDMSWERWARYEAFVNYAYDDFPVWAMCPYDTRATPNRILDEVAATHRHLATSTGDHLPNSRYTEPGLFLRQRVAVMNPIELTPPGVELSDPTPAAARRAVTRLLHDSQIDLRAVEGLEIAVSEAVTNAVLHGRPPTVLRAWCPNPHSAVVTVTDSGPGVTDPFIGLLPGPSGGTGGRGLWIAHQTCADVSYRRDDAGFTVVLEAGTAPTPWSLTD